MYKFKYTNNLGAFTVYEAAKTPQNPRLNQLLGKVDTEEVE